MIRIAVLTFCALLILGSAYSQKTIMNNKTSASEGYTFQLSDQVTREKVTFKNRYGIELAGDLYIPKNSGNQPMPALAISGPFGAVKEQSSGLYAN